MSNYLHYTINFLYSLQKEAQYHLWVMVGRSNPKPHDPSGKSIIHTIMYYTHFFVIPSIELTHRCIHGYTSHRDSVCHSRPHARGNLDPSV